MRNLILSAFPRNMRLPDPFTPNLKVDLLPEIASSPRFRPAIDSLLPAQVMSEVKDQHQIDAAGSHSVAVKSSISGSSLAQCDAAGHVSAAQAAPSLSCWPMFMPPATLARCCAFGDAVQCCLAECSCLLRRCEGELQQQIPLATLSVACSLQALACSRY